MWKITIQMEYNTHIENYLRTIEGKYVQYCTEKKKK